MFKKFYTINLGYVRNLNNIVKILLKSAKVDPNITDPNGLSLIDLAIVHKIREILEMLLLNDKLKEGNLV